jgi:hypothetical protein
MIAVTVLNLQVNWGDYVAQKIEADPKASSDYALCGEEISMQIMLGRVRAAQGRRPAVREYRARQVAAEFLPLVRIPQIGRRA